MVSEGLLFRLEAKADRDNEMEAFLTSALKVVQQETTTTAWFALRLGRSEYGIFNLFSSGAGRDAYLAGQVSRALQERSDMLVNGALNMQRVAVLADKLPETTPTQPVTKGLLLTFKAKSGHEHDVEQFLREAQPMVMDEPDTLAWAALRFDNGEYGIFDVFPDAGARFKHLTGHVPRELAKHAFTLLGSFPDLEMCNVLAAKLGS